MKKKLLFFVFCIFFIFTGSSVEAKDFAWEIYSEQKAIELIPKQYTEYCIYNPTVKVETEFDGTPKKDAIGQLYNDKFYVFIYDRDKKEILFLLPDSTTRFLNDGYYDGLLIEWDSSFNNQYVTISGDIYSKMVDENGNFSCADLIFIAEAEKKGDLDIYVNETEFLNRLFHAEFPFDFNAHRTVTDFYTSTKGKYSLENEKKCEDLKSKLSSIKSDYEDGYSKTISLLYILYRANTIKYSIGAGEKAKNYYQEYQILYDKLIPRLENIKDGIDICDTTFKEEYNNLNELLGNSLNNAKIYYTDLKELMEKDKENNENSDNNYIADEAAFTEIDSILNEMEEEWNQYISKIDFGEGSIDNDCKGVLGPDLLDDISTVLTWIRIAVPILLIILGCVDFSKIVIIDDQQEMKRCVSRFVKRCIIAVAIFFLPTIIMYLLSFIDSVADVSCDIRLW